MPKNQEGMFWRLNWEIVIIVLMLGAVVFSAVYWWFLRDHLASKKDLNGYVIVTNRWYDGTREKVESFFDRDKKCLHSWTRFGNDGKTILEAEEYEIVNYGSSYGGYETRLSKSIKRLPDGRVEVYNYQTDGKVSLHQILTPDMEGILLKESFGRDGVISSRDGYNNDLLCISHEEFDGKGNLTLSEKILPQGNAEKRKYQKGTNKLHYIVRFVPPKGQAITAFWKDGKTVATQATFIDEKMTKVICFGKDGKKKGIIEFPSTDKSAKPENMAITILSADEQISQINYCNVSQLPSISYLKRVEKYQDGRRVDEILVGEDGVTATQVNHFNQDGVLVGVSKCDLLGRIEKEEVLDGNGNVVKSSSFASDRKRVEVDPVSPKWLSDSIERLKEEH